ncbi:MotA/TolQ/ExbB proton channel family protein [Dinghuibacter silviterrae]|uniref:Outer membrane transport energization protein ExbB n=1 Tax=Dinghuibacter silviterrae TaxID=1539049 RepID=A0A4R8DMQ2_9BACT|nr:MotA/TolQ/ExbB proton channel family protein [Dinghuibacter silviterrae]TDW99279.1 outer membrane transport energization protein ExbB [Dinghuibacter silviterrae]
MAETKSTVTAAGATAAKAGTSVQAKKSSNAVSWIAPVICLIAGVSFYVFVLGNSGNFVNGKGSNWMGKMHEGGPIVPLLITLFLIVIVFVIERLLTITKALGKGNIADFVRKVQYHLANRNVDAALQECDKQQGSVANVMKAGLRKYKEMIGNSELDTEQKVLTIQKEVEEATALELPMLEKNLVFLSTIASVATLIGLLGTVIGMIRAFSSLGEGGSGGSSAANDLAKGISEALYNTALGIGTSAVSIIMYNVFTTRIDSITYGIDESGFTLTQSFASNYK